MKKVLNNSGFGVIEVVVSLALVTVLVASIGTILSSIYKLYSASQSKIQAYALVQEPLEIITSINNPYFACVCGSVDYPNDSCNTTTCSTTGNPPGQSCQLRDDFNSCWLEYPKNLSIVDSYQVVLVSGAWELQALTHGTREIIGDYSRELLIENIGRDVNGNIDPAVTATNFDTKEITVNVYWTERGIEKNVSSSIILTAWESLN